MLGGSSPSSASTPLLHPQYPFPGGLCWVWRGSKRFWHGGAELSNSAVKGTEKKQQNLEPFEFSPPRAPVKKAGERFPFMVGVFWEVSSPWQTIPGKALQSPWKARLAHGNRAARSSMAGRGGEQGEARTFLKHGNGEGDGFIRADAHCWSRKFLLQD